MIIYVPKPAKGQKAKGIFIADQRDVAKPFVITANTFNMFQDPKQEKLGFRLFEGTIHAIPNNIRQHHQMTFSTYDLKMDLPNNLKIAKPGRQSY